MGEISKLQAPECRLDSRQTRASKACGIVRVVYAYLANMRQCPNVVLCWADVEDNGPTLKQHWVNVLGIYWVCT